MHSPTHPFTYPIHLLTIHSLILSINPLHLLTNPSLHRPIHSSTHPPTHPPIHPTIHLPHPSTPFQSSSPTPPLPPPSPPPSTPPTHLSILLHPSIHFRSIPFRSRSSHSSSQPSFQPHVFLPFFNRIPGNLYPRYLANYQPQVFATCRNTM